MRRFVVRGAISTVLLVIAGAWAQDPAAPPDPTATARKLYAEMREAQKAMPPAAARDKEDPKAEAAKKKAYAAGDRFFAAFSAVDRDEWDVAKDVEIFACGVSMTASRAERAGNYGKAVDDYELVVDRAPDGIEARAAMWWELPELYAAAGRPDAGVAKLSLFLKKVDPEHVADLHVAIGDLHAAKRDFTKAAEAYKAASAAAGKSKTPASVEHALKLRSLIGRRAPELLAADWIGKSAGQTGFGGHVTVFATFTPQSAWQDHLFEEVGKFEKEFGAKGAAAFVATSFQRLGPMTLLPDPVEVQMPRNPDDAQGEKVKVTAATFKKHVETYCKRMRFGGAVAICEETRLEPYAAGPLGSALFVVDADQVVVHACDWLRPLSARGIAGVLMAGAGAAGKK